MASIQEIIGAQQVALLQAAKTRIMATASEVIANTPARTGRTKCSFQAAIGAPPTDTDPKHRGAAIDPSGQSALAEIATVVDQLQPGDKIFLASDYPNFSRTDEGDHKMAPHQQVERALVDWSR